MMEEFIVDMRAKKMPDELTRTILITIKKTAMTNFIIGKDALTKSEITEVFDELDISTLEVAVEEEKQIPDRTSVHTESGDQEI